MFQGGEGFTGAKWAIVKYQMAGMDCCRSIFLCIEFGSHFPFRSSFGFFIVCVHLHIQGSKVTRFHLTILVGLVSDPIQDNTSLPFDALTQPKPIIVPC